MIDKYSEEIIKRAKEMTGYSEPEMITEEEYNNNNLEFYNKELLYWCEIALKEKKLKELGYITGVRVCQNCYRNYLIAVNWEMLEEGFKGMICIDCFREYYGNADFDGGKDEK